MIVNGHEMKTTFWQDFTIADAFGIDAILDTYNRAFNEWKDNVVYVTELSLVLNWKIWQWYTKNEAVAKVYGELWQKHNDWCWDNLKGDDADYYFRITD